MTRLNILNLAGAWRDGEDAAESIANELRLRRAVLACLPEEKRLHEDGGEIAKRIAALVPKVEPERVAALAVEAREQMQLRRVPLLVVREMARHTTHRGLVAATLERVIQRADELCEFVAIYWKDGRVPLSGQVKKGLAAAFPKFDEHELARYDGSRSGPAARCAVPIARQAARRTAGGGLEEADLGTASKELLTGPGWKPTRYAEAGGPNQVVSASASLTWDRSPTQATYPSGRTKTEVGAVTGPSAGSSHVPTYLASTS